MSLLPTCCFAVFYCIVLCWTIVYLFKTDALTADELLSGAFVLAAAALGSSETSGPLLHVTPPLPSLNAALLQDMRGPKKQTINHEKISR